MSIDKDKAAEFWRTAESSLKKVMWLPLMERRRTDVIYSS